MKVLHVMDNLSKDSGVSSIVLNLCENINDISFDFLIFKIDQRSCADEVENELSKVYCLPNPLSPQTFIKAIVQLKQFFKDHAGDYDAVHLHSPTTNEFTLKYAKKYGIRNRIIHSHSTMTSPVFVKKLLNDLLQHNITRYANQYWACSTEAAVFLYGADFVRDNKVELIKNAVDPSEYEFREEERIGMREKLGLIKETVYTHISNYSAIKNLLFLVPIIASVVKKKKEVRFLFVGDGPTREILENNLKKYNLYEYCIFIGRQANIQPYLQVSDAFILPSLKEGLPLTVIEAQANGLPCFISDTITRECNIGNVRYIPLVSEAWERALIEFDPNTVEHRKECSAKFKNSDFNIYREAERVEQTYMGLMSDITYD